MEEGVVGASHVIEVDVYATVMSHEKISQRIDTLHGVSVALIRGQKPRVFALDEVS
jgi:hypothetical protein